MIFRKTKSLDEANDRILTETNDWLMKIKSGQMTASSEIRFHKWLAADPKHQARFDMMSAIWNGADVYLKDPQALRDLNEALSKNNAAREKRRGSRFHVQLSFGRLAVVATAVLLMVLGVFLKNYYSGLPARYQTGTGIRETLDLADGSRIYLDAETVLTVQLSSNTRRIELQKGRALFTVAHDPARPFTVDTGEISVRALGTEFNVYRKDGNNISIAVTEGTVRVDRKKTGRQPSTGSPALDARENPDTPGEEASNRLPVPGTLLSSGYEMIINKKESRYELRSVDRQHVNSWREGRLYFYMTPLSEVVDEVNRYLETKLIIGDAKLNELPISLNFDISQRNSFLPTLLSAMDITVKKNSSGHHVLFRGK